MNSKEKAIIGGSAAAALLVAALGVREVYGSGERLAVAMQTRDKAELAVINARLYALDPEYASAKVAPCELGPISRSRSARPILDATVAVYQCGEMPVVCYRSPHLNKILDKPDVFFCEAPHRHHYEEDVWKVYSKRFEDWKKTDHW